VPAGRTSLHGPAPGTAGMRYRRQPQQPRFLGPQHLGCAASCSGSRSALTATVTSGTARARAWRGPTQAGPTVDPRPVTTSGPNIPLRTSARRTVVRSPSGCADRDAVGGRVALAYSGWCRLRPRWPVAPPSCPRDAVLRGEVAVVPAAARSGPVDGPGAGSQSLGTTATSVDARWQASCHSSGHHPPGGDRRCGSPATFRIRSCDGAGEGEPRRSSGG
jgi:hypothetical protein